MQMPLVVGGSTSYVVSSAVLYSKTGGLGLAALQGGGISLPSYLGTYLHVHASQVLTW